MTENWQGIVAVIATVISLMTGAGVGYLGLFIKNRISESRDAIISHVDEKFALKELMTAKFEALEKNLTVQFGAFDGRISALERRGN